MIQKSMRGDRSHTARKRVCCDEIRDAVTDENVTLLDPIASRYILVNVFFNSGGTAPEYLQ